MHLRGLVITATIMLLANRLRSLNVLYCLCHWASCITAMLHYTWQCDNEVNMKMLAQVISGCNGKNG